MVDKPENSVKFIAQNLGGNEELETQNTELKQQLTEALQRLEEFSGQSCSGPQSDLEKLTNGFEQLQQNNECNSLLKNYLTVAVIEELAEVKTNTFNSTLLDCVQYGFVEQCIPIGFIAADAECYDVFAVVFDPMIRQYHRVNDIDFNHPSVEWGEASALINPDPEMAFVQKCQVNCYRSLREYPFFLKMEENHYTDAMELIRAFLTNAGEENSFYELETMDEETKESLSASKTLGLEDFMFNECNGCWKSLHYSDNWPKGRAIYISNTKEIAIRVNHKTHVQFGCAQSNGCLIAMYERMIDYGKDFDEKIPCARHEKYGWLTPFPQYLGTAMEVSALVKLFNLPKDERKFTDFLDTLNLKAAEIVPEEDYYYCDLRNARCLGLTEFQLMEEFCVGLAKVIAAERESIVE